MRARGPRPAVNTRENLPKVQQIKVVPMTEQDFARRRNRKLAKLGAIAGVVALVAGVAIWLSSRPAKARTEYTDATKMVNEGRYQNAMVVLDEAVQSKVNLYEALALRAKVHQILSEHDKAIEDAGRVLDARPDDPDMYRLRAKSYRELGQFQKAIADYDRVAQIQPDSRVFNDRGGCYRDLKQMDKALADFAKAVDLEPNADNLLQRGMAYAAIGDHLKAKADFDRVIEMNPGVPYPYRARATSLEEMGDRRSAAADRKRAHEIEFPEK